jgi:hypothetical protein
MPQIDPKDLDYSPEMMDYFAQIIRILIEHGEKTPEEARTLVERFFAMDVTPLERALVMHRGAQQVARDLLERTG